MAMLSATGDHHNPRTTIGRPVLRPGQMAGANPAVRPIV